MSLGFQESDFNCHSNLYFPTLIYLPSTISVQASADMQARLAALTRKDTPASSSSEKFQPADASQPADADSDEQPDPPKKAATKTKPAPPKPNSGELSDAAKMAKLRRVCEKKPSGKVKVPAEIHAKWLANQGDDRKELLQMLESAGWDKDWAHASNHFRNCVLQSVVLIVYSRH